ncbi:hypothetical protein ROZALSC1DRAFT_22085 [Rozella allomycis CSF55]|uniref:Uncharacterized protein n=1 Tax=Rozella allomycis (strain CSF55) TaxID=988480 RepID=A0A4P9YJT9_ROZAC|nr:hypothetical protein ROZALSC1DRAFT_22085 [Rozella allomycis CSF55]
MNATLLQQAWFFCHSTFISLYVVSLISPVFGLSSQSMQLFATLFATLGYMIVLYQTHMVTPFNKTTIMKNENTLYFILLLNMLMTRTNFGSIVFPLMVYSIFHIAGYLISGPYAISMNMKSRLQNLVSIQSPIIIMAAKLEVVSIASLLVTYLSGKTPLYFFIFYVWFIINRYSSSAIMKTAFSEFRVGANQIACSSKCPKILSNLIQSGINALSRFGTTLTHVSANKSQ